VNAHDILQQGMVEAMSVVDEDLGPARRSYQTYSFLPGR
jgi:hypothetical protein